MNQTHGFSYGSFVWWIGEIVNRTDDPLKIGRVRVKIYGYHDQIQDDDLPWAMVVQSADSAASKEIGHSPTGFIEGTRVVGFFADGENANTPVVIGSLQGVPGGNPDSHKLARGEELGATIIGRKRAEITSSNGTNNQWVEPPTPAAPVYPYNQMRNTESGHIEEFDDTAGAVRYGLWHPAGTWTEVHPDGTKVQKVRRDNYEIVLGDDYIHVQGNCRVNIMGDARVVVMGNSYLRVEGNRKDEVLGNYDLDVRGNLNMRAGGSSSFQSSGAQKIRGERTDINDKSPDSPQV